MRVTFVSAVPAMLGAVVWGVWDAHLRTFREAADEPWDPPARIWTCRDPPTISAERPGGPPLDVEVIGTEVCEICAFKTSERPWACLAPRKRAEARRALGIDERDDATYELGRVTRIVDGATWHRWDLLQDPR